MAVFYVDAENGASGNDGSTPALAKQFLSQVTMAAGNTIYLKRGQVHLVSTYRFFLSNMRMEAYGSGSLPIIRKSAGSDAWIYIQKATNVYLKDFIVESGGFNGSVLALATSSTDSISKVTLENITIRNSPNSYGLYIQGTGGNTVRDVTVKNCIIHDNYNHGVMVAGDVADVSFENCKAYRNGYGIGAHGFSCYAASGTPPTNIYFKNCESYENVDFDGIEGAGFQADNNSVNVQFLNCYSHDNQGPGFAFNASFSNKAIGCIATRNQKPALYITGSSTNNTITHNTFVGNSIKAGFSAEILVSGTSTGQTITNNILKKDSVLSTKGISLSAASATGSTGATNCIYGYTTVSENITLSGTIETDPLLNNNYSLQVGSPCLGTGTAIKPYVKDFNGKLIVDDTPDIGAIQSPASRTETSGRKSTNKRASTY